MRSSQAKSDSLDGRHSNPMAMVNILAHLCDDPEPSVAETAVYTLHSMNKGSKAAKPPAAMTFKDLEIRFMHWMDAHQRLDYTAAELVEFEIQANKRGLLFINRRVDATSSR